MKPASVGLTWFLLLMWGSICGGAAYLAANDPSIRHAYFWSASGGAAFFIALVNALRLGQIGPKGSM